MAADITAALAVLAGVVLIVGLVRIARLMFRIARTLASVRLLSNVVAQATSELGQFVTDIGENVRGLEEVSEDIGAEH